ncbi:MAG TPA: choice-of-anchor D domain-containing protein [Candidatus Acidoferrum sp.]|nr:choice-of-anchor D domain-containing protein [Candidatus Acidoferrum sp.]
MKLAEGKTMRTRGTAKADRMGARQRPASLRQKLEFVLLSAVLLGTGILGGCAGLATGTKTTTTGQAAFQVSPTSVSFGKVNVGKQATQTIAVSNTGTLPFSITQATISNPQFSLTGVTLPMAMATGQSGNFTVAVTPSATGSLTGTLTVQGDNGAAPAVVNLSATAVASAPQISLSSNSVQFGTVSDGSTGNATLLISNNGNADLTISLISVSGTGFGVNGITTPKTISAGQSVSAGLTFQPTVAGGASGTLSITSNDPVNPTMTVALAGTGSTTAAGQLQANPTSLSFGSVGVGSNSTKTVVFSNTGTAAIQISTISVSGTGFSANGITAPLILNPAATATLNVVFAPTAGGSASGSVTVTTDQLHSPMTISLTGIGAVPGLSITPTSFVFGSLVDGQTKSQTFTLTNTGSASLTISQVSVSGTGYSLSGLTTPSTIAAGATATFGVLFAPTTVGSFSGTITIASNAPGSPLTVALSGSGTAGTVSLSANPTSLAFGSVNAGTTSSKSVTLTNSGTANVTISQVTVSAKDVTTSGVSTPVTLTPGQTQTLTVAFKPTAAETVSGNVTLTNSVGGNTVIAVSGTGLQAGISLTPSSAGFGSVVVGAANSQTIKIGNPGTAVLTITQANVTGSGFGTTGLALPLSINPGATSTFNAQYQPSVTGAASGSITIVSNAGTSPSTVSLTGTGVAATQILSFSTNALNFGNVTTGSSSTLPVTVTNTGNSNVQISQIAASGTGYSLSGAGVPVTLTPSQSLTFSVIFGPAATGSFPGSVTVTSNATGSPATITLSGSGVVTVTHSVSLSWTASTSTVNGYNVYRSLTSGTGYTKLNGGLVSAVTYTDSTVANGTTYYYVTTAVDASGNESTNSNEAVAAIP